MNRKDIKIGDLILVYKYESMLLGVCKVEDIFTSEKGRLRFECKKMEMPSKNELKEGKYLYFVDSEDVIGMFNTFDEMENNG